jgi:hypothetical protein
MEEERFLEVCCNAETQSLDGIWSQLQYDMPSFTGQRDLFFQVLERLLQEQRIKLHRRGVFLQGSIEEQVEVFRMAFPCSEADADRQCTKPGRAPAYEGFGMNVWWFLDLCPAGVAWRAPDGTYQMAD